MAEMGSPIGAREYSPVFTLGHDYGGHHFGCTFDAGDALCSCGFAAAYLKAHRYVARLESALEDIASKQRARLDAYRALGIVFDGPLGTDPKNWQHVAFSTYTDLCEVETQARSALEADDE